MHPILALVAVIAFTAAQAHAAPCPDWTTDRPASDFWRAATVTDIAGCIEAGAKVEARDKYGMTPLHMAALQNKNPAVVAALIEAGTKVNARGPGGYAPLHRAAMGNENPAVATALLEAGANPRAKANNGKMPIDYAMDNEALKGSKVYWRLNDARFGD